MPPGHPPHPPHPRRSDGRVDRFLDRARIDRILRPWVPNDDERAFVVRCLLDEGPAHHRGSNWVLLASLAELVGDAAPSVGPSVPVPMRLPPHLADGDQGPDFPLSIPREVLERLAPGDERAQQAMIDCLVDGPPQHALSNAALLCLIDAALRRGRG